MITFKKDPITRLIHWSHEGLINGLINLDEQNIFNLDEIMLHDFLSFLVANYLYFSTKTNQVSVIIFPNNLFKYISTTKFIS